MGSQPPAPCPTQCGNTRTVRELWHDIKVLGSIEAANAVKTRLHYRENHARSQKRHDTTRSRSRRDTRALQQKCNAPQCEMSVNLCDSDNTAATTQQQQQHNEQQQQQQTINCSDMRAIVSRAESTLRLCVCVCVCVCSS